MIEILASVVIAALIFASLVWQLYRMATTAGVIRWNAAGLCLATIAIMTSISLNSTPLMMLGAAACVLLSPIAIWADPRWSKLLPLVQLAMGLALIMTLPAQFA